jgi:hypothetical protein
MGVLLISTVMIGIVAVLYCKSTLNTSQTIWKFVPFLAMIECSKPSKLGRQNQAVRPLLIVYKKIFVLSLLIFKMTLIQGQGKLNMKQYFVNFYSNKKSMCI